MAVCSMFYRDEFVRGNSLFYTVLFQDMLTRFHRIDLTSSKMAFQLSRVCKVFNEPQLIDKLRQGVCNQECSIFYALEMIKEINS